MGNQYSLAMLAAALVAAAPLPAAHAQWSLAVGLRAARFSGGAEEPATGRSLRPYRPTLLEAGVSRWGKPVGVGVRVYYASSSLALEGAEAVAAVKDAIEVYGLTPEVSARISQLGPNGVLRAFAGPTLEIWKLADMDSRLRVGVSASLGLEVPFGGRWSGEARLGAGVIPASPFTDDDLDPALRRRALWRREITAELSYRL